MIRGERKKRGVDQTLLDRIDDTFHKMRESYNCGLTLYKDSWYVFNLYTCATLNIDRLAGSAAVTASARHSHHNKAFTPVNALVIR